MFCSLRLCRPRSQSGLSEARKQQEFWPNFLFPTVRFFSLDQRQCKNFINLIIKQGIDRHTVLVVKIKGKLTEKIEASALSSAMSDGVT